MMTETEKQARREAVINDSVRVQVQSIRDWNLMLMIIEVPPQIRIELLEYVRESIDHMIMETR